MSPMGTAMTTFIFNTLKQALSVFDTVVTRIVLRLWISAVEEQRRSLRQPVSTSLENAVV